MSSSASSSPLIGVGTALEPQRPSLYLVRHGERAAFRQRSGRWDQNWAEGRPRPHDDPLTPLGKQQAEHAAACILANQSEHNLAPLKRVICSPFVRCVQTGYEIARKLKVPLVVDYSLCERLKEEWFKPQYLKFEDIYLTVDKLKELKEEINAHGEVGAPFSELKLFDDLPLECIPSTYENDEHEKDMPRPKNIAAKLNKHSDAYASSVLVSHGGVAYWIARALCAEVGVEEVDLGTVHYCGTACFTLKQAPANGESLSEKWHLLTPFGAPLRFTPKQNWCQAHEWKKVLGPLLPELRTSSPHHPNLCVLELGAWEGLSAKFWKGFFGTESRLVVVDHFDLYNEDDSILKKGKERLKKFHWNLQLTGEHDAVTLLQDFTFRALTTVIIPQRMIFDFIYIDADHSTVGVLSDAILAWQCLRKGGLMLFDDYLWPGMLTADGQTRPIDQTDAEHPKRGIDAFLSTHKEQLEVVYSGYQVLVRKTVEQSFPFPESSMERVVSLSADGGEESEKESKEEPDAYSSSTAGTSSTIAVLLPLTSRGQTSSQLHSNLKEFESCLPSSSRCVLMIGLDEDDEYFSQQEGQKMLQEVFDGYRIHQKLFKPQSPPRICEMANELAKMAFNLPNCHCDYFVLLGDDVRIEPKRKWLACVEEEFESLHSKLVKQFGQYVPAANLKGLGVVALNDVTFPGFPTFPIVSRKHVEMFHHRLSPDIFVNQDMDPFIWAVYRPFGARVFAKNVTLRNTIGGESPPRYERQHVDWKNDVLEEGIGNVQQYLLSAMKKIHPQKQESELVSYLEKQKLVTLDVIVPTYRGIESILRGILSLPVPDDASVCFIIIVDDPSHGALRTTLEQDFGSRVLVRVNEVNQGASYSRNRGIEESSAKWNVFIDDDVVPHPWVLIEYVNAIREKGHRAAGFVGLSCLPPPNSYITAGLTISYLTYFWRVAEVEIGGEEAPWAVTANVCARRGRHARFDRVFAKTGGGEDIAYLRLVMQEFQLPLIKAPRASVEHPWWSDGCAGQPHPRRYYRWAKSDVILMDEEYHPQHTFYSLPAFWEFVIMWSIIGLPIMCLSVPLTQALFKFFVGLSLMILCESAADIHEACKPDHGAAPSVVGWRRKYCALLGCVFKNFCEAGHVYGPLRNGRWQHFCKRFDWWYGLNPTYVQERREKEGQRAAGFLVLLAISYYASSSSIIAWSPLILSGIVLGICLISFIKPSIQDPNEKSELLISTKVVPSVASSLRKPMQVAFVSDEKYAHHLAVALKSLLNHRDSDTRIDIHIIDAGISDRSWHQLTSITDHTPQIQIHRHEAPKHIAEYLNIDPKSSPKWVKLWLDEIFHDLDEILYLDSDILVKGCLNQIWNRLNCKQEDAASSPPVQAVVDFGLPHGEASLKTFGWNASDSYFNAGVMLIDLASWRQHGFGKCLRGLARDFNTHRSLPYDDQDILNLVFRNRWKSMDLKFNVQGLGSYAEDRCRPPYHGDADKSSVPYYGFRRQLFQDEKELELLQKDAVIVHFTGTCHPSLSQVLNSHVKVASKPDAWFTHLPSALVQEYSRILSRTPFAHRLKTISGVSSASITESRTKLSACVTDDDSSVSLAAAVLADLTAMVHRETVAPQLAIRAASIVAHRSLVAW